MTRRRSSPLGLELVLSVVLALVVLPLLSHGAPVQESHADLQKYTEGCYYNYNHYSEGDRILTNEPCLNCTCHNRMLMCYLRVCPFTKPIGHDCTVEKREDQCCPIVTCPEVPVDIAQHSHQLTTSAPGTELSIPEKYGCSIDSKFYVEGAQVPSNPHKPCELCYCIRNRTACLMQECTLHIDGCQPIYNKGSCCPVRYNCDHENELLEIEDFSTTTTTIRPTEGYLLTSTTSPSVTTDCVHNDEVYADGASITGRNACERCYCMRGDIVCAVRQCEMPTLESGAKTCRALPPAAGECCPSNYVCDDDSMTTDGSLTEDMLTTITPIIQSNLHDSVSQEDVQLQEHIDDKIAVTDLPTDSEEQTVQSGQKDELVPTTILPIAGDVAQPNEEEEVEDKVSEVEEEKPILTTTSAIKKTSFETTQSPIEHSTTHKTEEEFETSHKDKEDESTQAPIEDETINEEKEEEDIAKDTTTISPVVGDIQNTEDEDKVSSPSVEKTTVSSIAEKDHKGTDEETVTSKENVKPEQDESTASTVDGSKSDTVPSDENVKPEQDESTASTVEGDKPESELEDISATTLSPVGESEDMDKQPATETASSADSPSQTSLPSKAHIEPEETLPEEDFEKNQATTTLPVKISKPALDLSSTTLASVEESEGVDTTSVTQAPLSVENTSDAVTSVPSKEHIKPQETSSESVDFSEETTASQGEIHDKIDEDISESSAPSSTSSPVYEMITEGDNSDISMPEIEDHRTESDLPKKKPKDEPESVEPIPSDATKDELPQGTVESTSVHADANEVDEDSTTPKPSVESIESVPHEETSKPSTVKDDATSDESTQGTIEEKPVEEDEEVTAVVQEITGTSSKPISGDISEEKDTLDQTTGLPIMDTNADKLNESQDKKDEEPSTEEATGTDKRTTTGRPVRIHIADEEKSTELPTKGTEKDSDDDSTTTVPSIVDSIPSVTEREEDSEVAVDYTSSAPTGIDSEKPIGEENQMKGEQDTTVKPPSVIESVVSSAEEDAKPEKESEILPEETSTDIPSKGSEQEHAISESATIASTDSEAPDTEDKEVEVKPQSDTGDSTTSVPSIDDSEEAHGEEDQNKVVSEHVIESTSVPSIVESETAIAEEEEHKKKPEESLTDSTTKHPSVIDNEEPLTEEDVTKSKPGYDSTEIPAIVNSVATNVDEDDVKQKPESAVDSTTTPSESKPEDSSIEDDVKGKPEVGDSTTLSPAIVESGVTSAEEDVKKTPEHEISTATGSPLPADDKISEKEPSIGEAAFTDSSVEDSGITVQSDNEKQGISDSTTTGPAIADESGSSNEEHKEKPVIFEHETPISVHSTTVASPVDVSGEEVKEDANEVLGDLTTVSPSASQQAGDEEIKQQSGQDIDDSSTETPVSSLPESPTASDEVIQIQQQTTIRPSLADSGASITEKEQSISEEDFSTIAPSIADASIPTQTTDAQPSLVSDEKQDSTTAVPVKEVDQEKQSIDKIDDLQTTLTPIEHSDKESSVPIDVSEGGSVPFIPSAIPGEGDCLANGKTFENNASIPTFSDCELSCTCINSIVVCQKVQCYEPPTPNNCVLAEASTDKCCPQYICRVDSFEKDQRPTTPEEIEDEEIQFTTLAPTRKYTDIPTESEKEEPISQTESSKTELPAAGDNATPPSIYFEEPIMTPQEPMSHVKADEAEEASTEHSGEDIIVEGSTTTKQPITAKPTKQVTGDIEQSIEVTSAVPEYSAPSKKPDYSVPVATDDEEEQGATAAPTHQEHPSTSDAASEPEKATTLGEEITTKSPLSIDVLGTDKVTEGILEKEITTIQPIKLEASSEAPFVPVVTVVDDSAQSEETPETSGESSNESGEETDSEEITKSPMVHKEEDQKLTTSRPLVSEHVGDIEPVDESTNIPEIDLGKPEMPEDLSHTKVDDEVPPHKEKPTKPIASEDSEENEVSVEAVEDITTTPASTIKEKPTKPIESGESEENQESEEAGDKIITTPASTIEEKPAKPIESGEPEENQESEAAVEKITTTPVSTIKEKPTKPIGSEESEENQGSEETVEDITSTPVSTIKEKPAKPIDSGVSEENQESEEAIEKITTKPVSTILTLVEPIEDHKVEISDKKDEISSSESEEEKPTDESTDHLGPHEGKPFSSTIKPVELEEESESTTEAKKNKIDTQTSSPAPISGDVSDLENDPTQSQTISPVSDEEKPITSTILPAKEGESSDEKEDITPPTRIPAIEEHFIEGSGAEMSGEDLENKKPDMVSSTSAPHTAQTVFPVSSEEIPSSTSVPDLADHTPIAQDEHDIKTDDIPSQTSAPSIGGHPIEGSGLSDSEDKSNVEQNEITSQTSVPTIDKQPTASDLGEDKIDVTASTPLEEGSGSPTSEVKSDVEQDEIVSQTIAPTIDTPSSPTVEDHSIEGSGSPISEDKTDLENEDIASQTNAPTIEKQTPSSDLEKDTKNDVTTSTPEEEGSGKPTSEDKSDIEQDEIVSQTSAPAIDTPAYLTVEENSVEGSGSPISGDKTDVEKDEVASQTNAPSIEKQPVTSDLEDESKIDVTTSTPVEEGSGAPTSEDKFDVVQDEIVSQTSAPAHDSPAVTEHSVEGSGSPTSEDKTDVEQDEIVGPTSPPATEKQHSTSELEEGYKIDVTYAPISEDRPEGSGLPISEEDIANKEKTSPISEEEPISATLAPVSEDDSPSVAPSVSSTIAPVLGSETEEDIPNQTNAPSVIVPSSDEGEESDEEKTSLEAQTTVPVDEKQTTEKAPHVSTSSEEGEDIMSGTVAPDAGDKYEETDILEDKKTSVVVPVSDEEKEMELTTVSTNIKDESLDVSKTPAGSIPTKDIETSDESVDATETPSVVPTGDETMGATESSATSVPVKTIDEDKESPEEDGTSSTDIPIKPVINNEKLDVSKAPAGSIPVNDIETSDANVDATETPSKDTSFVESGDESSATSAPVKTIDEDKESPEEDGTSSADIPKTVDEEDDSLDATKLPVSSTPAKTTESIDEATKRPQTEESSSADSESVSPVTVSTSTLDEEVLSQTQVPSISDVRPSEDKIPISQTDEQTSDEEQQTDKTILTSEGALLAGGTESPSIGSDIEESDSDDKLGQTPTDKPMTETKRPELVDEESSTKPKDESQHTDATVMPETISSHEVISHPSKPESDDQILVDDIATAKPLSDVVGDKTESPADSKKPSLGDSPTTQIPTVVDKSETDEQPEKEKPESVEEESAEDTESKTPKPASQPMSPTSSEEDVSSEDTKPEDIKPVAQTESPSIESVDKEISADKPVVAQTEKPSESDASTESEEEEEISIKITTTKPSDEIAPTESEEHDGVKVSSTVAAVDEQPITSSEQSYSTEKLEVEKEHTEAPKNDTKIQTIGEFVTERADDLTTVRLPIEDNKTIPELPETATLLPEDEVKEKPELPETATLLPEDEVKEKPEVSVVTENNLPGSSSEESEEQTQVPVVAAENIKPHAQPTSSTEESDEKTQAPEVTSEMHGEGHKPQVPDTTSVNESEEKTQVPETQTEITEEDHKQHVQPTEGAIASTTSDKPIVPTLDDKIDSDLPKPIVTDDQSISEEETPLSTTIHPLFPHIEHDRTTYAPQLNASDKVDHKVPELPSAPTTEQPTTSQAITSAPTSHYQPPGYGQVPPQYPSYTEDEYTDEDETEVFGPGTCRYGGKLFVSAQQIPRDDPCDFCFCFRSDIICLQQSCPPPISGCHEEPISGFCCPRYECPVSMATTLNITTSTTTTSTTLPPHFLHHAYRGAAAKNGCHISGKSYKVGDKIDSASGPCMHCTCGGDGQMKCDPKTCSPEPMLRQMIAVVASRRR